MKKYNLILDSKNYTTYEFKLFEKYLGVNFHREKIFGNNIGAHIPEKMINKLHISYNYLFI